MAGRFAPIPSKASIFCRARVVLVHSSSLYVLISYKAFDVFGRHSLALTQLGVFTSVEIRSEFLSFLSTNRFTRRGGTIIAQAVADY